MYRLVAKNAQGATVTEMGKYIKDCLTAFDVQYYRKGWKIWIYKDGVVVREVKKSYR